VANVFRNDLTIEGTTVQDLLGEIGFQQPSLIPQLGLVLIDFPRILPKPPGADAGWEAENWRGLPYDGWEGRDLFELAPDRVAFQFFTKHAPVQNIVATLAERFPALTFTYIVRDEANDLVGGEILEDGKQSLFVNLHYHEPWFIEDEESSWMTCDIHNCEVFFPAPSTERLDKYRRLRQQNAIRMAEEFGAEEAP
jgi:hypothetical protein